MIQAACAALLAAAVVISCDKADRSNSDNTLAQDTQEGKSDGSSNPSRPTPATLEYVPTSQFEAVAPAFASLAARDYTSSDDALTSAQTVALLDTAYGFFVALLSYDTERYIAWMTEGGYQPRSVQSVIDEYNETPFQYAERMIGRPPRSDRGDVLGLFREVREHAPSGPFAHRMVPVQSVSVSKPGLELLVTSPDELGEAPWALSGVLGQHAWMGGATGLCFGWFAHPSERRSSRSHEAPIATVGLFARFADGIPRPLCPQLRSDRFQMRRPSGKVGGLPHGLDY